MNANSTYDPLEASSQCLVSTGDNDDECGNQET